MRTAMDTKSAMEMEDERREEEKNDKNDKTRLEERMRALEERLRRTRALLGDLQEVSKQCEEANRDARERHLFSRRVVQITSELEDARDLVQLSVRPWLSPRQFNLIASEQEERDISADPSVRFFGIDWQDLFSRALTLSLNAQLLSNQLKSVVMNEDESRSSLLDLMLVHSVLKDLSRIQLDVSSHAEAILQNRLSKSQQRLMQKEQLRLSHLIPPGHTKEVTRSRSFRDNRGANNEMRVKKSSAGSNVQAYRKTKTAHLEVSNASLNDEWQNVREKSERKTSIMQNVSAFFKHMR